jgi:hypothetical protein
VYRCLWLDLGDRELAHQIAQQAVLVARVLEQGIRGRGR